jgi:hypothetical protein
MISLPLLARSPQLQILFTGTTQSPSPVYSLVSKISPVMPARVITLASYRVWSYELTGFGEMGLKADRAGQFLINQSNGRSRAHENEFNQLADLTRPSYSTSNQGPELQVPAGVCRSSGFSFPLNCWHYKGGVLKGAYATRLLHDSRAGVWKRSQKKPQTNTGSSLEDLMSSACSRWEALPPSPYKSGMLMGVTRRSSGTF